MEITKSNDNGVFDEGYREIVAQCGRWYAAIKIAFCEDGLYRYGVSFIYSYGGFAGPVCSDSPGCASLQEARMMALEELLHRWHTPFPSDPQAAHDELRIMREQIERQLQQPTFL
jgi:hypothetical protein